MHNSSVAAYGSPEDLAADSNVDLVIVTVQVGKHDALTKPVRLRLWGLLLGFPHIPLRLLPCHRSEAKWERLPCIDSFKSPRRALRFTDEYALHTVPVAPSRSFLYLLHPRTMAHFPR